MPARRFALDHSFPLRLVDCVSPEIKSADLTPVSRIDARLCDLDDWKLLRELSADRAGWDGLITTDTAMLLQAKELVVLRQTKLSLVVVDEAGHNPVLATGLLLAHLDAICGMMTRRKAQVWHLKPNQTAKRSKAPDHYLQSLAQRMGTTAQGLAKENRLARDDLTGKILG